jgi:hypothetical protein
MAGPRLPYVPPADDDAPLDFVEQAIRRALSPGIVEEILAELAAEQAAAREATSGPKPKQQRKGAR